MDCEKYNQYYTDVVIDGAIVNSKCFKGSEVYSNFSRFKINDMVGYSSGDYYSWINENFREYSFPDENIDSEDYSPELVYKNTCNPEKYSLKPQQKFVARAINTHVENNGILVYHGLGSGKTQTSIIVGEAFKFRSTDETPIAGRADTHVLIVVPASLVDQYYNEIIGSVENGNIRSATGEILINGERQYYIDELTRSVIIQKYLELEDLVNQPKSANTDRLIVLLKKDIRRLEQEERKKVNTVYEILSHDTFLNRLFDYTKDTKDFEHGPYLSKLLVKNGLLIIDEIQNLISAIGSSYRKLLYAIKFYSSKKFRVVLLTGTPIYDKPFEFGLVINLLRPRILFPDGYEEFNEFFVKDKELFNKELFQQMCSGYVSYFKGGNPEAYPYKKTTIMHHSMGPYQYSAYKFVLSKELFKDITTPGSKDNTEFIVKIVSTESIRDEMITGTFTNSNLVANIAFPETRMTAHEESHSSRDSVLKAGLAEFKKELTAQQQKDRSLPEPDKTMKMINFVTKFSSKFAKVAELIMQSKGPSFIYSNFVYYGVDSMAAVLHHIGYLEFPKRGPLGSYFIWKGKTADEDIRKAKLAFNSRENKDGSILKVILGTQTIMEGVDFKNVRQIHILDPWWNDSRIQQIIARGIRLCSHRDLPSSERYVDVFIHLSTIGTAERLFDLKIMKKDVNGNKNESKVKSRLILENPDQKDPNRWVFREAYVKLLPEDNYSIRDLTQTFLAGDIVSGSIRKVADPEINRAFGGHKGLDTFSVQEYMHNIALRKLKLNRQFETAIKEVAIDCSINRYGNIVRLDEVYSPSQYFDQYTLEYENYANGERYIREGLPGLFTLRDILDNVAMTSGEYSFRNKTSNQKITLNKSLIVLEDINCTSGDYSISNIPEQIRTLSINKELIPYLMKMSIREIKNYFYSVETGAVRPYDPLLRKKLKDFLSKDAGYQKEQIINKFLDMGIGQRDIWELYPLDRLKKEYSRFKFQN